MSRVVRLRMFAGPNGSGKSTIIEIIRKQGIDLGIYVNADEIKKRLDIDGCIHFKDFDIEVDNPFRYACCRTNLSCGKRGGIDEV